MKAAKVYPFLIIGVVVLTGVLWFSLRQTPSPGIKTVYKSTPVSNAAPSLSQTHAQGKPHSHDEETPHTHAHERPSDSMIRIAREELGENPNLKNKRWLAYLESEEGRAFFDSFPTADEWFEKSKSFGFFQKSASAKAWMASLYREHFPTGTVDENEPIIRDIMRGAILEREHHKEAEASRSRNTSVLIDLLLDDEKYAVWILQKFDSQPPSSHEWIDSTFEEIRLAERKKYLDSQQNDTTAPINDFTRSERPTSEREGPPGEGQTPANTRNVSEDIVTVDVLISDDGNTPQAGIEGQTPTLPAVPELPTNKRLETALRAQFSPKRFNSAMQTLNQYGPEEGLRRLKDADPEVAKQVERLLPKRQEPKK